MDSLLQGYSSTSKVFHINTPDPYLFGGYNHNSSKSLTTAVRPMNFQLPTPRSSLDRPASPTNTTEALSLGIQRNHCPTSSLYEIIPLPATNLTPPASPDRPPIIFPLPEDILDSIRMFLLNRDPILRIGGFTSEMKLALDEMVERGDLPGWDESLRSSFSGSILIVQMTTAIHEISASIFCHSPLPANLRHGGAFNLSLQEDTKCPDFTFWDDSRDWKKNPPSSEEEYVRFERDKFPTVAVEVAYRQQVREANDAAVRLLGGSFGSICLVIVIDIEYSAPTDCPAGRSRDEVGHMAVSYWTIAQSETLPSDFSGEIERPLPIAPPAHPLPTHYTFVIPSEEEGGGFVCLTIERSEHFQIIPESPSDPQSLKIYNYHLYRELDDNAIPEAIIDVSFNTIRSALSKTEAVQAFHDNKKRKRSAHSVQLDVQLDRINRAVKKMRQSIEGE